MATTTHLMNARRLMANLTADDIRESLDYYTALGFEVTDRFEEDGVLLGVMLKAGTVEIGLSQDDGRKARSARKARGCACTSKPPTTSTRSPAGSRPVA